MTDTPPLTPQLLYRIAVILNAGEIGAIENMAGLLDEDLATLDAWCAGTQPISDELPDRLLATIGANTQHDPAWRRDEWLLGLAGRRTPGPKRLYLFHLWPPRFRCRAIEIDPDTGGPVQSQEPAAIEHGISYPVADELVLAEFEWIDPPPRPDRFVKLLDDAGEAVRELIQDA